jgi:hypothetical protein
MSTEGSAEFVGLRARLRELEEDKATLERKLARAEVEHARMSRWFSVVLRFARGRARQAALDGLFSLRWPKGVKPRAATLPLRTLDEDTQP